MTHDLLDDIVTPSITRIAAFGADSTLIECLEAFELWLAAQQWEYQYDSAKAGFMGAWFLRPSNGHVRAFTRICSNCGDEFQSNHRPHSDKKAWCGKQECRRAAAAERARAFRERKAKEKEA